MMTETHTHTVRCWWNPDEARWVCRDAAPRYVPGPVPGLGTAAPSAVDTRYTVDTPDTAGDRLVDTRDMVVVHTAMLREFRLAPAAVCRTAAADHKRVAAVAAHLRLLCDLLHHHHAGEDELLWPLLRKRAPSSARPLIDEVEAQHGDLDAALAEVTRRLQPWARDPRPVQRDGLAASLERLHLLLREHLELEERALLPLAAAALSETEWAAIGAAGAKSLPKPAMPLIFGMFMYEGDPEVIAAMLAHAPLVPRTILPRIAPRAYARRARAVHATATP